MASTDFLNNFQKIRVQSPTNKIIRQVRGLINPKQLSLENKQPSERRLSEKRVVG